MGSTAIRFQKLSNTFFDRRRPPPLLLLAFSIITLDDAVATMELDHPTSTSSSSSSAHHDTEAMNYEEDLHGNTTLKIAPVLQSRILLSASLQQQQQQQQGDDDDDNVAVESSHQDNMLVEQPQFAKLSAMQASSSASGRKSQYRRIRCPPHRYTPLREHWEQILTPLVEYLKLQVRFNVKTRSVELKTSAHTLESGSLQKGADFVSAFMLGFDVQDAVALLRLDDLYVESFQVTDVKMLHGDHLSRAIGRLAGQDGKTRFAIENATRTRIVIADQRIHLLGSYGNLRVARNAICDLILGAPPGKVYNNMRHVAKRMSERY